MSAKFVYTGIGWTNATLASPFTTFAITPAYMKDSAGNVHIRGNVDLNGAADGDLIFTLPAGFRPTVATRRSQDAEPATTSSCRVLVLANGEVRAYKKEGTPTSYYLDMVFSTL